jgi:hypothetical protein
MPMNPRLLRPKRAAAAAAPTGTPASLLLRFDGSFADSSPSPLAATAIGSTSINAATVKWGSGSAQLVGGFTNGSTSGVRVEDSAPFGFGTGDFTLEGWFYSGDPSATNGSLFSVGTFQNGILVRLSGGNNDPVYVNGTAYAYPNGHGFPTSQWTHIAVVRNAGLLSVYVAGQRKLFVAAGGDIGSSRPLLIGSAGHAYDSEQYGSGEVWVGYVDDVRVVRAAVYSEDSFTAPTAPLSAYATPVPQESTAPLPAYGTFLSESCGGDPDYRCCSYYADGNGGSFDSCGDSNSYGTFTPMNWEISGSNFGVNGQPTSSGAQLAWPAVGESLWGGTADTRKYVLTGPSGDIDVAWTVTTYFMPLPSGTTSTVTIKAVSFGGETASGVTLSITTPTPPPLSTSTTGWTGEGSVASKLARATLTGTNTNSHTITINNAGLLRITATTSGAGDGAGGLMTIVAGGQTYTGNSGGTGGSWSVDITKTVIASQAITFAAEYSNGAFNSLQAWIIPPVAPPAPTSLTSPSQSSGSVYLTWTAPANDGGSAITDYAIQYSSNSGSTWTNVSRSASTALNASVSGLTNGTSYQFRVAGVNSVGTGSYSSTTAATPTAGNSLTASGWSGAGTSASKLSPPASPATFTSSPSIAVGTSGTLNVSIVSDDNYNDAWEVIIRRNGTAVYANDGNLANGTTFTVSVTSGQTITLATSGGGARWFASTRLWVT